MNFDDIQAAWNNENESSFNIPQNLELLKSAQTPLEKIRKNLKNEFVYQTIAIIFIGFLPFYSKFPKEMLTLFYLLYSVMVAISIYYLGKLFLFFKRISVKTLNTKDSLYETYTDIRINMELYKTFSFALSPFLILYLLGSFLYGSVHSVQFLNGDLSTKTLIIIMVIVVLKILFMGVATEWWVYKFYGKYAKEIKKVLEQLKE